MKRISLFVFLLLPTAGFGQSGSSQLGPFSRPLDLKVTVNGIDSIWNALEPSNFQIEWKMDPADTDYHLSGDTISYNPQYGTGSIPWFTLVFDSSNKTISNVRFGYHDTIEMDYLSGPEDFAFTENVSLDNFSYDSSSIYTTDSTLLFHHAAAYYNSWNSPEGPQGPGYMQPEATTLISVSSMTLSGSFDSVTLTNASDVVKPTALQPNMSIFEYDGSIQCSFPSSSEARAMELYTPLGVKAAAIEVPAGQSEISLPRFVSGLYFLRMDGNVIKVALP